MTIRREVIINSSIEKAWQILGVEFEDAYKWSSVIKHSEAQNNESLNGSSCTQRGCNVAGMGEIKEKLISFSPDNHKLSYQVFEGLPGMVKYAENNWELESLEPNKTKLTITLNAETQGFMGTIMKPMMKMNFAKMMNGLTKDFKYYVEKGKPTARKIKAMKKAS